MVVPVENIMNANAIYFHQKSTIQTLLLLDSLHNRQQLTLHLKLKACEAKNTNKSEIIDLQSLQIDEYDKTISQLRWLNRGLISLLITLFTWEVIR